MRCRPLQFGLSLTLALLCLCVAGSAAAQQEPDTPLAISEVAPGVYVHVGKLDDWVPRTGGDIANLAFIVGSRCIAVIDTGGTPLLGRRWRATIERTSALPICYVINTHAHPDHVLGNAAFVAAGTQFVGAARLPAALAAREPFFLNALQRDFGITMKHDEVVYPTVQVDGRRELDLGGRVLSLQSWQTAHTDNDLTVDDRITHTLFTGDLLFVQHLPVVDGNLRGWLATMQDMAKIDAQRAVPGHGPASVEWPAALQAQQTYLETLRREVRTALKARKTLAQTVHSVGSEATTGWKLAEQFHRRNVTAAYAELEWED